MLGGSKLGGHAQHNSGKYFCSLCLLLKGSINCIDPSLFPRRTMQTELESAQRWRDAASPGERDAAFKETGIRWSALYELEYWDPTQMLAADPMHNLFLGLVQYHCRAVMGIDFSKKRIKKVPGSHPIYDAFVNPNLTEMSDGQVKLANATSVKTIERLNKNVLWVLCAEHDINLQDHISSTKGVLVELLWVRESSSVRMERLTYLSR